MSLYETKRGKKWEQDKDLWRWSQIGIMWTKAKACYQNLNLTKRKSSIASTGSTSLVTSCFWIAVHLIVKKHLFFLVLNFVVTNPSCHGLGCPLVSHCTCTSAWRWLYPAFLIAAPLYPPSLKDHAESSASNSLFISEMSLPSNSSCLCSHLWDLPFYHSICSDVTCHVVYLSYGNLSFSFDNWTLLSDAFLEGPKLSVLSKEIQCL